MIREFSWNLTHMFVYIDYSTDYCQTFTQYCHDHYSTFAGISLSKPASDLIFYPNPASGQITVETPKKPGNLTVEIFDLAGKCRINSTLEPAGTKTDISDETLPEGVYFVRCNTGETQPVVRKLVVRRSDAEH
jgi:hypothetical protein